MINLTPEEYALGQAQSDSIVCCRMHELLNEPWKREVLVDNEGNFVARVPEFPGCEVTADSPEKAIDLLENDYLELWISKAVDSGFEFPEPQGRLLR